MLLCNNDYGTDWKQDKTQFADEKCIIVVILYIYVLIRTKTYIKNRTKTFFKNKQKNKKHVFKLS